MIIAVFLNRILRVPTESPKRDAVMVVASRLRAWCLIVSSGVGAAGLCVALTMGWVLLVFVWPGLPVSGGSDSVARQSSVLLTVASVVAALMILTLTVGSLALQVLSQFSWRLTRTIVDGWLTAWLVLAAAGGVALPLWVAVDPSRLLTRIAAASAGWSALAIVFVAFLAAQRIAPVALAERICSRAIQLVLRRAPDGALVSTNDMLAELVSAPGLPYATFRLVAVSYMVVLAARSRTGISSAEIVSAVRGVAAATAEATAGSRTETAVVLLGGLGIDQAANSQVHAAVWEALLSIARQARTTGNQGLANAALDAVAVVVDARVELSLSGRHIAVPQCSPTRPGAGATPAGEAGASPAWPNLKAGWWPLDSWLEPTSAINESGDEHRIPRPAGQSLIRMVDQFARGDLLAPAQIGETLVGLGPVSEGPVAEAATQRRVDQAEHEVYELLSDTVTALRALLPAPHPDSTMWPSGWQGTGALDTDVCRIAELAAKPYRRGQYPPTDIVEETLEAIAGMLRQEPRRDIDWPVNRTGWRDPATTEGEGGPAARTALSMASLMGLAFESGFDRRALLTGRRILAAATRSAQTGDAAGLKAYCHAVDVFTRDAILHGRLSKYDAGRHRQKIMLAGLLAEVDQLLAHEQKPELRGTIHSTTGLLAWRAPRGSEPGLATAWWQARLLAAGWPVPPPGQLRLIDWEKSPKQPEPLPRYLLKEAEESVCYYFGDGDPILISASVIILWVHAAASFRTGNANETQRIAKFLADQIKQHDREHSALPCRKPLPGRDPAPGIRAMNRQVRRLASAAVTWCSNPDTAVGLSIPAPSRAPSLRVAVRRLLDRRDFVDWTYYGICTQADEPLVIVEERDASLRLLRDGESRARGLFGWGYGGTGPYNLAEVLVTDAVVDLARCPACLGAGPCAARVIQCRHCGNTGRRRGHRDMVEALVTSAISQLPQGGSWERTRRSLLTYAVAPQ